MLVAWRYRFRNSFLETLDPRARWITSFFVLFAIIQFWDVRFLLFFFALSMTQYFLSRLTWKETRRAWLFILFLVVVIIGLNAILTGRGGPGSVFDSTHILLEATWKVPVFGWTIHPTLTVEKTVFAFTQMVRMLGITTLFFIIPWTQDPQLYGVTFNGMGLPYRYAFSMDLAFRFVPSLARDFSVTLDSQRARGYEVDKLEGGLIAQIRKIAPLLIPVTMNSIVNGEDITNAMDLRCFGLGERTWINKLSYGRRDYIWMGFGLLILLGSTVLNVVFKVGDFWVPEWAFALAG
jgi:energy-coupling factor transport system permease protein